MALEGSTPGDPSHAYPDEPSVENFVRRSLHASLVLGNFVYIDGGEIAMLVDGEIVNMKNNDTLTIDVSSSWDKNSAPFGYIDKHNFTDLNVGLLFPAPDNGSFFQFGGETSWLYNRFNPPDTLIYHFSLLGDGDNGTWSNFNVGPSSGFNQLTRPTKSLSALVDNTFLLFGGVITSHTSRTTMYMNNLDAIPLDGIVSFNMSSGAWSNSSMPSHLIRPHGKNGIANPVPNFGPAGLMLAAGTGLVDNEIPNFKNITIYEPRQQTWHYQTTTGDIPAGRDTSCNVGVQGDNGTYEIFIYGGRVNQNDGELLEAQIQQNIDLDEVYVLSLPAFAWFRADYPAKYPRYYHTCQVVGNRQMLSIGGLDPLDLYPTMSKDAAIHGLNIFDMTAMEWRDSYDAGAAPYTTPQIVKDWYQQNGTSSVQWNDPIVKTFFAPDSPSDSTDTTISSGHHSSTHTGAIAGGVVGGLAAICILTVLIIWLLRRHRKSRTQLKTREHPYQDKTAAARSSDIQELPREERRLEAEAGQPAWEKDGMQRVEMDAGVLRSER